MTKAERTVLEILREHGPTEVWHVDRWFTASGADGFAPRILSNLVRRGWVTFSDQRYELSATGRDELDRGAA